MSKTVDKLRTLLTVVAELEADGIEVISAEAAKTRPPAAHIWRPSAEIIERGTAGKDADYADYGEYYSYQDRGVEVFWLVPKPAADNNANEAQS